MNDVEVAREHTELAEWDAAFVLGSLTPGERRRYERHVEACRRCRTAVTELSGLPGLLAAVPLAQVVDVEPPEEPPADLLPRLSAAVTRRRRRRTRFVAASGLLAAAAVVVAVAVSWPESASTPGAAAPTSAGPTAGTVGGGTVAGTSAVALPLQAVTPNPLAVEVTLVAEPWGTRMQLQCRFTGDGGGSGPERNYGYALYATNRAGATMSVTSWTYGPDTVAEPVGTSKWPVDQIATVEVRADDGTVLLRGSR